MITSPVSCPMKREVAQPKAFKTIICNIAFLGANSALRFFQKDHAKLTF